MFWDNFYNACLEKGIKPNPLAKELDIASGSMTTWKKGGIPNGETLIKLADYLDVSVDYLLDRTDQPNGYNNNQINNSNNVAFGENSSVNINNGEIEKEICSILNTLNLRERSELLTMIYQFSDKCKNKETL